MNVLMIGATGSYAHLVVPALKQRNIQVRALIRHEDQTDQVRQMGVEDVAIGNLDDPSSLKAAAEGMDGVFHINPAFASDEANMGVNMVHAAQEAGVRKFVFSSVYHPSLPLVNHSDKQPVEAALYESKLEYTILQPAMFMQNFAGSWSSVQQQGKIAMPYSKDVKVTYVDYRDVAEVAAIALAEDTLSYGTFELSAPGMVDRKEIAATMSEALGKTVVADEIPVEAWEQNTKMPDGPMKEGLLKMFKHYNAYGFRGGNALVLKTILEREPRTLRQYIHELAKHGR